MQKKLLSNFLIFTCEKDVVYEGKDFCTLLYFSLKTMWFCRARDEEFSYISLNYVPLEIEQKNWMGKEKYCFFGLFSTICELFDYEFFSGNLIKYFTCILVCRASDGASARPIFFASKKVFDLSRTIDSLSYTYH